jgi:hypothetical protein
VKIGLEYGGIEEAVLGVYVQGAVMGDDKILGNIKAVFGGHGDTYGLIRFNGKYFNDVFAGLPPCKLMPVALTFQPERV